MPRTPENIRVDYEAVAASATDQVLGGTGGKGDILERLIVTVATAATAATSVKDGTNSIPIIPTNAAIGTYVVEIGAKSIVGAWKVTTAAGATVLAVGQFSA